jgi:hypothetical protein
MITPKLAAFIIQPNGMGMGTIDQNLKPEFHRVLGASYIDDEHIKIFIDEATAGRTLSNLQQNPRMAVVMVDTINFESYQFKGKWISTEKCIGEDLQRFESYMKEFDYNVTQLGFTPGVVYNYPHSTMLTLIMQVEEIFEQTPKKGTGQKL